MAQRTHVPKFGNWESEENVPYTQYFDKARKGRTGGKMINPNDPQENPDLLQPPAPNVRVEPEEPTGQGSAGRRAHERRRSRDDNSEFRQAVAQPQRAGGRGGGAVNSRPAARNNGGSENSFERSPLHPNARISGRNSGGGGGAPPSPLWEGGNNATPGRSRMRTKGDESPVKGAAVPKFGEWDESNPASADGYTHIFNKVREERQGGGLVGSGTPGSYGDSSYGKARKHNSAQTSLSCCFPWRRK